MALRPVGDHRGDLCVGMFLSRASPTSEISAAMQRVMAGASNGGPCIVPAS